MANRKSRKTDGAVSDLPLLLPGQLAIPGVAGVADIPRDKPKGKAVDCHLEADRGALRGGHAAKCGSKGGARTQENRFVTCRKCLYSLLVGGHLSKNDPRITAPMRKRAGYK